MARSLSEAPLIELNTTDMSSGEMPVVLARRAQELGPVFRWFVSLGPRAGDESVFLVGPEANRFVLQTHRRYFSNDQGWSPLMPLMRGKGLLNMDDPEHARYREAWNPGFTAAAMEGYFALMERVVAERIGSWAERGEVDLYEEVRRITFEVAATGLAGIPHGLEVERLQKLFYTLVTDRETTAEGDEEQSGAGRETRFARLLQAGQVPKALQALDELIGMLLRRIAERRAIPADEPPRDVLGLIVCARDENNEPLGDKQVLGQLFNLLVAGHETTTVLGTYVLYLLATLPEQRERVENELNAVLGKSGGLMSVKTAKNLPVLENFIKEAGRLYTPTFNLPRGVVQDIDFAGYTLPAGTAVWLATAACHRLPSVFSNPDVFDPDRFAPPREEDKRTPDGLVTFGLVTFGGGPRMCIGMHFANILLKVLAVHVLRTCRLQPVVDRLPVHVGLTGTLIADVVPMRVFHSSRPRSHQAMGDSADRDAVLID